MKVLLDTHALLWWLAEPEHLSMTARDVIAEPNNEIFVSAASFWEIATKHRLGKLPGVGSLLADIPGALAASGLKDLVIACTHAHMAGAFSHTHRDPFDRMIAAQGIIESFPVLSIDPMIAALGATVMW
jgi:PIN domain nuclease of toxin-antitoxin system